jgi:hypothetical protein
LQEKTTDYVIPRWRSSKFDKSREHTAAQGARPDKLRKDIVFMWRSLLYPDVRISLLTVSFSSFFFIFIPLSLNLIHNQTTPSVGLPLFLGLE